MNPHALREALAFRFRALRHRNFRLFWSGQLTSLIGTWMQSVAQGWLMYRLTESAFWLGLLWFLQFLPVLLFSLGGGVVADRVDKRKMMMVTQSIAMLQAVTLAMLATLGVIEPWMLLVLAFTLGTMNAFDMPTRQSFIIELVGRKDLSNAIALNSAAFNSARIIGPAIAGVLVAVVGEVSCFWINAASYLATLAALSQIRRERPDAVRGTARARLTEGIHYALGHRQIRTLLTLLGFMASFGFQYMVLLPIYAREILDSGPETYGLMVTAFGIGALLSALWMTRHFDRWGLRRNLLAGLTTAGIGLGVFAWSEWLPLTLLMGFAAGFGLLLYVMSTNVLLQLTTEDRYRGRVMSLYTLMFVGTAPLGALAAGWIAERSSAPIATSISAAVLFSGAMWVSYRLRVIAIREAQELTEAVGAEKV